MHSTSLNVMVLILCAVLNFNANADVLFSGKITRHNKDQSYLLTDKELQQLPQSVIKTGTPWTPVSTFKGVKLVHILSYIGATGAVMKMHALNDYTVDIPVSDARDFKIILATSKDGKQLTTRDFGPYFIIYPIDDIAETLNRPKYLARFIWQVDQITIE